ncbi:helix-turn-helix transcriptional regulator [Rathayibacter soli]|uniref:helix-turn-helix transcriptional regulator n=1 Tax=Rathayibacter soli TaxID=3144168 RepID=UPI0027E57E62|nr:helix-turn-helix domain-containing protein [Glaciibacter superstes]
MAGNESPLDPGVVASLGSLDDPVRRRLYEYIRDRDKPAGRDQVAGDTGISRTLVAYHLDKLVEAGLLRADYARPPGRSGPGAGRPAKIYSRSEQDLSLSVPPRDYELLARLLVSSVDRDPSGAVRDAVNGAAYATGQSIGADSAGRDLLTVLGSCGYQPRADDDGTIELCNCPFHALSQEHRDIVCGLNLHLIRGVLDSGDQPDAQAELTFRPNRCCVTIQNTQNAAIPRPGLKPSASASEVASKRPITGRHTADET